MDIKQALKSDDIEILILYSELALKKYSFREINKLINKEYYLFETPFGEYYIESRKRNNPIKLHYENKSIINEL